MPTPVDQASFAELVQRFQALIDLWCSLVRRVLVMAIGGTAGATLNEADHGGKALLIDSGSSTAAVPFALPANAAVGAVYLLDQAGPGPIKLVPAPGAALRNRLGHNGSAGQWASIAVRCVRNTGGNAAEWLLGGDTAVVS